MRGLIVLAALVGATPAQARDAATRAACHALARDMDELARQEARRPEQIGRLAITNDVPGGTAMLDARRRVAETAREAALASEALRRAAEEYRAHLRACAGG